MIALEKGEDLLLNFNKNLANYYFSKSEKDKEIIYLFIKEIKNLYSLNSSHRFELLKNFILIQAQLFADIEPGTNEEYVEDLILRSAHIAETYPKDQQMNYYKQVINYFWFEYYYKINQLKKAEHYFELVQAHYKTWLLLNNYCLAFKFILTKPEFLFKIGKMDELKKEKDEMHYDPYDFYTQVSLKFRSAITYMYTDSIKESMEILSDLIRDLSLHHFFHFEIEIKLTLSFLYIKQNKMDRAEGLMTSIGRKINSGHKEDYSNAHLFLKLLNLLISKNKDLPARKKVLHTIQQFYFHNNTKKNILSFLKPEIELIHTKFQ